MQEEPMTESEYKLIIKSEVRENVRSYEASIILGLDLNPRTFARGLTPDEAQKMIKALHNGEVTLDELIEKYIQDEYRGEFFKDFYGR